MYGGGGHGGGHSSRGRESQSRGRYFEQQGDRGGGSHRPPDRSRSRDREGFRGGRGGGHGGRGGGYGGRGGGGRPGGGYPREPQPRPETAMLKTNFYTLKGSGVWFQYLVEIIDGKKVWIEEDSTEASAAEAAAGPAADQGERRRTLATDSEGRPIIVPRRRGGEVRRLDLDRMAKTEHPLPVRIMKQLMLDEIERLGGAQSKEGRSFVLAYDHANAVYAPRRMFDPSAPVAAVMAGSSGNAGEDQDEDAPFARSQPGVYHVRVKKDCEPDDPDADKVPFAWYIVRLREVAFHDLSSLGGDGLVTVRGENAAISQVVNTMLRSAFAFAGFPTISSYSFIKDPFGRLQNLLQSRELRSMLPRQGQRNVSDVFPSVGILQMLKYCMATDGTNRVRPLVQRDAKIGFLEMPGVPILQDHGPNRTSIAGVEVGNSQQVITDDNLRSLVETALAKKKFDARYTTQDREQERRWREEGLTAEEISQRRRVVRGKNLTMKPDREQRNVSIIWDPSTYTFPIGREEDAPRTTVEAYFRERYGIHLRYPRMPLVHTFIKNRSNWLPIEFLYQSFGKAKDANDPKHVRGILAEKDSAAGPMLMNSLRSIYASIYPDVSAYLASCNLQISNEPVTLRGKILPVPKVRFAGGPARVDNGSWDLRNAEFLGADMNSFGVLDLSPRGSIDEYLGNQFPVMERHDIILPDSPSQCVGMADHLIVRSSAYDAPSLDSAFDEVISRAKDFFIHDRVQRFGSNNVWFKSRAVDDSGSGQVSECLVIPNIPNPNPDLDPETGRVRVTSQVGLILPRNVEAKTHQVTIGDKRGPVRIMVGAVVFGVGRVVVDPFDTRYWDSSYQVKQNGTWVQAEFQTYLYQLIHENGAFGEVFTRDRFSSDPVPEWIVPATDVECPAVIFVCLREHDKVLYPLVKKIGSYDKGITTQVIALSTFENQKNKPQYCSAVALKLNGKLSNRWNRGRAWTVDNLPWYSDRVEGKWIPTLIIGLSMSRGQGQRAIAIVAATACLDQWGMQTTSTIRVQDDDSDGIHGNGSIISRSVMIDITTELATQFSNNNGGHRPQRVLVYRDGLSDGNFPAAINEIESIRQAFYDLRCQEEELRQRLASGNSSGDPVEGFHCTNSEKCQRKGCVFCTPTITLISCQNEHGIKLVPSDDSEGVRGRGRNAPVNVPSGTVVDHTITEGIRNLVVEDEEQGGDGPSPPLFDRVVRVETSNYDFLLIPQGGLKGTSKPVYYRILLNENDIYDFAGGTQLTRSALERLTNEMSSLYSTATKATRCVPVVHYSKSLANQVMGWINYLLTERKIIRELNEHGESEYFRVDGSGRRSKHLLPAFGPYDPDHPERIRPAFRPCGLICAMAKKG